MQKYFRLIYALAILKFLLPYFLQDPFYQPHRDEYLYLVEGRHLAWGYMEIPPLLPVFARITHWLGDGFFWIKFWPNLTGAITLIMVTRLVAFLGGRTIAILLASLPFFTGGFQILFFLFQPNFLDVFFWTAMAYSSIRFFQTGKIIWLYTLGISTGLGMMSKYSAAIYAVSLVGGILLTSGRKIFLNRHFYFAIAIALLTILPNLVWQYNHCFPVIHHMEELQEEQLKFIGHVKFLVSQLFMNLASTYVWIAGLIFAGFNSRGKPFRYIAWAYGLVILLLVVLHGKDYYALGAYPILYAVGGFYLESLFTRLNMKWTGPALITASVAFGILILPFIMPVAKPATLAAYFAKRSLNKEGPFQWEDQKQHPLPQDYADMMGWKEMTEKTARVFHQLSPDDQSKTMIYCRGYYFAGALNFYGKEFGLPEVYSDNASFLFWMPDRYSIKNLILVAHQIPGPDDKVFQQFEKMTLRDSLQNPLARENGVRVILFENGNDKLNSMIEESVKKLKAVYARKN